MDLMVWTLIGKDPWPIQNSGLFTAGLLNLTPLTFDSGNTLVLLIVEAVKRIPRITSS